VSDRPEYIYRPAWWVPGPHAQTMWAKFLRRRMQLPTRQECVETPDGDSLDLLHLDRAPGAPRVLVLHGLEGTPRSHYVTGLFEEANRRGWNATLLSFRGCGPGGSRGKRLYHSGETGDTAHVVGRLIRNTPGEPLLVAGISLGGNVLLKWLGEMGDAPPAELRAAAAVSVPFDLERGALHLQRGFARIYDRHFLQSLRRKARAKLAQHGDLFDAAALARARTIYEFDDAVTAPVHGFASAHDYYRRSSALGFLRSITVPTLLLSAVDDPFLPADVLEQVRDIAKDVPALTVEFHPRGGHVGFVAGVVPWRPRYHLDSRLGAFFADMLARTGGRSGPVARLETDGAPFVGEGGRT
jgi:predicted alpha/beta-fold hydrolase